MSEWLRQGILGLIIVAIVAGFLQPRYVVDEYKKREAIKDAIIERQSKLIERLAARRGGAEPKDSDDAP